MKLSEKSLCAERGTVASSPGKIFLCGEHAVVSGYPGLLASVNRKVTVTLSPAPRFALQIGAKQQTFQRSQFSRILQQEKQVRSAFTQTGDPATLLPFKQNPTAFLLSLLSHHASLKTPFLCSLKSELPFGSGLGSSAAIASATIGAGWKQKGIQLRRKELFRAVQNAEVLQHGTPSGADAYACIYGRLFLYRKEPLLTRPLPLSFPFASAILHTGKPRNSTAEVVAFVQKEKQKEEHFQKMAAAQEQLIDALSRASFVSFRQALLQAHEALQSLRVTTPLIDSIVRRVRKRGIAAKLCGAGTIQGKKGGALLLVHPDQAVLKEAAALFPYPFFPIRLGCPGLQVKQVELLAKA